MKEGLLKEYTATYDPKNGHQHKCITCFNKIQPGDKVIVTCHRKVKYYPVKGLMGFLVWRFEHTAFRENRMGKDW